MSQVQARTVLWYLVFVGFAVNYMIRINLNITIVEMVIAKGKPIHHDKHSHTISTTASSLASDTPVAPSLVSPSLWAIESAALIDYATTVATTTTTTTTTAVKGNESEGVSGGISPIVEIKIQPHISGDIEEFPRHRELHDQHDPHHHHNNDDQHHYFPHGGENLIPMEQQLFMNATPISLHSIEETSRFHWNEYQQGLVLGSFFWAHWVTQIPGGILAKKYGTKLVFGLSNAIGCWMCFLIPAVSHWDYRALIWLRVMQGLITGLAWPAMHVLTAKWIPPNERSKFVTAYLGSSVGIALCYPLFGYVMHWSSWPWVYHICGILGTIWWLGWLIFVFDSPAQHPRISETEMRYIEKSLGVSVQSTTASGTPWKEIFLSRPVWMNVIAQWGGIWGLFTLMTQAPTYFRVIHNWDIKATGILSGLPHLLRMIFAYAFSLFADYLLTAEKMSRTNIRKLATAICCILKGILVLALAYFGHNSTAAIVFLTLATMFHGAVSSGPLASIVDIAPNFAGIVLGVSGMIGVLPGFISPYIIGILTLGNQTFDSWKNVFLICAAMLIGSGVLYVFFADSTLQNWNDYSAHKDDKELQELKKENQFIEVFFEKDINKKTDADDAKEENKEKKNEMANDQEKLKMSS